MTADEIKESFKSVKRNLINAHDSISGVADFTGGQFGCKAIQKRAGARAFRRCSPETENPTFDENARGRPGELDFFEKFIGDKRLEERGMAR